MFASLRVCALLLVTAAIAEQAAKEKPPSKVGRAEITAALSEEGYQAVAKLKSNEAMKTYIDRLLKANDLQVLNQGDFEGFVPYFSGTLAVQDFDRLKQELLAASWTSALETVANIGTTSSSSSFLRREAAVQKDEKGSPGWPDRATFPDKIMLSLASQKVSVEGGKVETTLAQSEGATSKRLAAEASFSTVLDKLQARTAEAKRSGMASDIVKLKEQTGALMKSAQWLQNSLAVHGGLLRKDGLQMDAAHQLLLGSLDSTDLTGEEVNELTQPAPSRPLAMLLQRAERLVKEADGLSCCQGHQV